MMLHVAEVDVRRLSVTSGDDSPVEGSSRRSSRAAKLNDLLLHEAVMKNEFETVKSVLETYVDVNSRNNYGRAPIHWASSMGNTDILNLLLGAKCDIEAKDKFGMRPLLMAAWHGHKEAVKMLINAGANVNILNKKGFNVLMCAAAQNREDVFDYLLEALENIDFEMKNNEGMTCLHVAAAEGHDKIVAKLLSLAVDPNSVDKKGRTPLLVACEKGNEDIVEHLIEAGADLQAVDSDGNSALHIAAENKYTSLVVKLLAAGLTPQLRNKNDNTALHFACIKGCRGIVDALLQSGCNINCQNDMGNSPLHMACESNYDDLVELLIRRGADINLINENWQAPIHIAAEQGYTTICKTLLSAGAKINLHEQDVELQGGRTPLYIAARGSFTAIVDMIIKTARIDYPEAEDNNSARIQARSVNSERRKERLNQTPRENQKMIEEVMRRLAFKQMKEGQWVVLAHHWAFTTEQIKAIQHEYTGPSSYKEHGFRMLMIWLESLDPDDNPIKHLYESLIAINEPGLAESMKKHVPASEKAELINEGEKKCCSCSIL